MQSAHAPAAKHSELYNATIAQAVARSVPMVEHLLHTLQTVLQERERTSRSLLVRDASLVSINTLQAKAPEIKLLYSTVLRDLIQAPLLAKKAAPLSMDNMAFDQLELLDEVQVQESVSLARAQQMASLAVEASLADLNTLICTTLGLPTVQPERNPLRPEVFINALKDTIDQIAAPADMRLDWIAGMSAALGAELRQLYMALAGNLREKGVVEAGYAVVQTHGGRQGFSGTGANERLASVDAADVSSGPMDSRPSFGNVVTPPNHRDVAVPPAGRQAAQPEVLLTLDRLRSLLAGELDDAQPTARVRSFSRQFEREFEQDMMPTQAPAADFSSTVPAALEALQEMQQVDQVVERLKQRHRAATEASNTYVRRQRQAVRQDAVDLAQALSLEVVTLMLDNLARDPRLLAAIQNLIRRMEPPLLRLALIDPRFFSDKQHPARALLEEIAGHSLAFGSEAAEGFQSFYGTLEAWIVPLFDVDIQDATPFAQVMAGLQKAWALAETQRDQSRKEAVQVLQHAEQRNLLSEKIAREIDAHPDAVLVPEVVIDFLCNVWAQVVAQARLVAGSESGSAEKYQALISALLWSTHPVLSRKNPAKLTRLVPLLLSTLRDGLETINYPAIRTSVFLEALMAIHQQAFQSARKRDAVVQDADAESTQATQHFAPATKRRVADEANPWVAPREAQASNLMDLSVSEAEVALPDIVKGADAQAVLATVAGGFSLGTWVEMWVNEQWVRTQLTWASPHGTLFLFTSSNGTTQSMTLRTRDKLMEAGKLRFIAAQSVVDGALDAVAKVAMRNSLDSSI